VLNIAVPQFLAEPVVL